MLKKLEIYGEKNLSDIELLLMIFGKKNSNKVVNLYEKMSNNKNKLMYFKELEIKELVDEYYFSKNEAMKLKAICEFSRRINLPVNIDKRKIKTPQDVFDILASEFTNEKNEILKLIVLNNKNIIKRLVDITNGKQDSVTFDVKTIILETIKTGYSKIILVHNHPSGDSKPSEDDIAVTNKIKAMTEMLGIKLLDHIIIGDNEYTSILYG